MKTICFAMPGNEKLTNQLTTKLGAEKGEVIVRHFPDEETYVRILSDVKASGWYWCVHFIGPMINCSHYILFRKQQKV